MMALALLLIFANGIIYVIAYKRCKVNLMATPIQNPPMLVVCLLAAEMLLFLLSRLCGIKWLNDLGLLFMALFLISYAASDVRNSIRELSEIKRSRRESLGKSDQEKRTVQQQVGSLPQVPRLDGVDPPTLGSGKRSLHALLRSDHQP